MASSSESGAVDPEFSRLVQGVADGFPAGAPVTASELAAGIGRERPEYAGDRLGKVTFNVRAGARRPVAEWLSAVRDCYDPAAVAPTGHEVLDGRLTLAALAALDPPLAAQLGQPTLAALAGECEIHPVPPAPREHVRWLADEPVGLDQDELGRRGVASALEQQLEILVRDYPGRSFLVHIDGAWGAGKSTLLRFLRELAERAGPGRSPAGWLVVPYDAWRQSKVGPPWLTLLHAVRAAVRTTRRRRWARAWFWLRERARLVDNWQWAAFGLMAVVVAGLVTVLVHGSADLTVSRWGDVVKLAGGLLPVLAALWLLAKSAGRFASLDSRRAARAFLENRADPMEDLAAHFDWVLCQAGRPVLLLVDDLDRCPETFVVDLLDAVQKLMRDRGRGTAAAGRPVPNLLVVVAADGRWVRSSYDTAYASLTGAISAPGATIGSLFLEKLFQLTVPVPRLSDELKAAYLADLLADGPASPGQRLADPDLTRRLTDAPPEQVLDVLASAPAIERIRASQVAIDRLVVDPGAQRRTRHALEPYAGMLDPTPRAMKRFVMAYSMLRAVRTAEGSVVGIGPLALWTILQTRWPTLAEHLQATPSAVRLFALPADQIPHSTPAELRALFAEPPADLRVVMNHPAGPMDERTIRECSGQAISAPP